MSSPAVTTPPASTASQGLPGRLVGQSDSVASGVTIPFPLTAAQLSAPADSLPSLGGDSKSIVETPSSATLLPELKRLSLEEKDSPESDLKEWEEVSLYRFECPWCCGNIEVEKNQLNSRVFRHAVSKSGTPVDPHCPEKVMKQLIAEGINGCGMPFNVIDTRSEKRAVRSQEWR